MAQAKHTHGPWYIKDDNGSFLVKDCDDITICGTFNRMDDDMEESNARLIASAPELLQALEDAQQALANAIHTMTPTASQAIAWRYAEDKARAAIKLARGTE